VCSIYTRALSEILDGKGFHLSGRRVVFACVAVAAAAAATAVVVVVRPRDDGGDRAKYGFSNVRV